MGVAYVVTLVPDEGDSGLARGRGQLVQLGPRSEPGLGRRDPLSTPFRDQDPASPAGDREQPGRPVRFVGSLRGTDRNQHRVRRGRRSGAQERAEEEGAAEQSAPRESVNAYGQAIRSKPGVETGIGFRDRKVLPE